MCWGQLVPAAKSATTRDPGHVEVFRKVPVGGQAKDKAPAPVQIEDCDTHS